ncbi:MAG: ornithine carbamoyltransferase [Anaerolineales bacterium]|jgi:ornithine carbamoyltransferase|nr:ornithine carbamoyltransferase [Anaerolineales bacterium]
MSNFLAIDSFSRAELEALLELAAELKREYVVSGNQPLLRGKTLAMIFQKPSLRTRVSFEMAMRHLGGSALYLSPQEIGLGKRESVADVARVLSGYVDGIMARVFTYEHVVGLAEHASVPVINGLSDYNHPCQALTDIFTIMELRPQLQGLKMAFVGDGNNVATSLLLICARLGINFTIAAPEGYELDTAVAARGRELADESGADFRMLRDPIEAVTQADIIYTDVWTSMGKEEETERRRHAFQRYQVNRALLAEAEPDVLVMHDLPAHRGDEITDAVADGPHSVIFQQAHNRLHAQKAILTQLLGA